MVVEAFCYWPTFLLQVLSPSRTRQRMLCEKSPCLLTGLRRIEEATREKLTALEVGTVSESKFFLGSAASQKVVDAVYRGQVIYTPLSFVDILPDHYKHHPVSLYDPREAPLLNQYRLIVPRIRSITEVCQFAVLLTLYVLAMTYRQSSKLTVYELIFCIYTTGWILEEFAPIIEHGWQIVANETAEIQFRPAVLTFEGVKSDAIFAYRPPFNILALLILLPTKFLLSPRRFHQVKVFTIRVLNGPVLLIIGAYERQWLWRAPNSGADGLPKRGKLALWIVSGVSPHGDIQAICDVRLPQEAVDKGQDSDLLHADILENDKRSREARPDQGLQRRRRSKSV
ncbi:uncharacterized protein A1O9_03923 [Exophiala aquamarina CBS 119918]|uniref:Calcium channel YVC1-like C-terminal transmembrane domain-containing protein n=1 Tax=Exophiala aquamarina CBS 119918 TaxID=1182545 RepID=A0A072PU58_9EURO|nr:uncharacterized protein A1O9_03923 [Exophiala aquamarina CBS 119918]KEF59080.1 hypothetical protein A1O9_03923 [Exophiala aquamarina CBS 119918]